MQQENSVHAWAFSASQYVQTAIKNVKDFIAGDETKRGRMPKNADTPLMTSYHLELDVSPELNPTEASYYMSLIGVLQWIVELGRVDICFEVSMMSSHLALQREGHLGQVLHIFAHLKKSSMIQVTLSSMSLFMKQRTGPPVSLVIWMGKRTLHPTCPSPEVKALWSAPRWMQTMPQTLS